MQEKDKLKSRFLCTGDGHDGADFEHGGCTCEERDPLYRPAGSAEPEFAPGSIDDLLFARKDPGGAHQQGSHKLHEA